MAGKSKPPARNKRLTVAILLAILSAVGLILIKIGSPAPDTQAQIGDDNLDAVLDGATEVIRGGYQEGVYDGGLYKLWQYRSDSGSVDYNKINTCDENYDGLIDKSRVVGPPPDRLISYEDRCDDYNASPLGDNLEHEWNTSDLDAAGLEGMQPFLAIGVTEDTGFDNPKLELYAWIPKEATEFTLIPESLCDADRWDTGALGGGTISITAEGEKSSELACTRSEFKFSASDLGAASDFQTFTIQTGSVTDSYPYKQYKVTVAINSNGDKPKEYTNQFRLKIKTNTGRAGYLGVAKTDTATGQNRPNNALGLGMRLPGHGGLENLIEPNPPRKGLNRNVPATPKNRDFKRLQILWEVQLYAAIDPEEGCSVKNKTASVGLFDHDYNDSDSGAQAWTRAEAYRPTIRIHSINRNGFLDGTKTWQDDAELVDPIIKFELEEDSTIRSNGWDLKDLKFDGDKIYRFHFYNLDQKSWVQIGLPFAQYNALIKCVDKPLVKVYHGDVSVGGVFGTSNISRACREQDDALQVTNPNDNAHIYTHNTIPKDYSPPRSVPVDWPTSSAEYAVYARGEIDAFYSGFKSAQPSPPNSLTFANTTNDPWGGKLLGELRCIPNWWRRTEHLDKEDSTTSTFFLNQPHGIPLGEDIEKFYSPSAANKTLAIAVNENPSPLELKAAIYVEGNLHIQEDIINKNDNRTKLNQIKSIYFIVKGDIFIESGVTRIDAVLIAIPTDDAQTEDGRIFTCYVDPVTGSHNLTYDPENEAGRIPASKLDKRKNKAYDFQCRKKLTINGALIARQLRLGRVTDPNATYGQEGPVTEEINFLPEYHIGTPQLPTHTDWYYTSDSVTILPVNF